MRFASFLINQRSQDFHTISDDWFERSFPGTAEQGGAGVMAAPLFQWIIKKYRIKSSLPAWNSSRAILPPPPTLLNRLRGPCVQELSRWKEAGEGGGDQIAVLKKVFLCSLIPKKDSPWSLVAQMTKYALFPCCVKTPGRLSKSVAEILVGRPPPLHGKWRIFGNFDLKEG
jgi:hypothetical protein